MNEKLSAAIEFKHQYPKDLNYKAVLDAIISDVLRTVEPGFSTTHFILILQMRKIISPPKAPVKFLERDAPNSDVYLRKMENTKNFPSRFRKEKVTINVSSGIIKSSYEFLIYDFKK